MQHQEYATNVEILLTMSDCKIRKSTNIENIPNLIFVLSCPIKEEVYTYAECFVCKRKGHLSKSCPRNPNGIYPKGGACFKCGDKTHLSRNCTGKKVTQDENVKPEQSNQRKSAVGILDVKQSADADVNTLPGKKNTKIAKKSNVVKF